MTRFEKIPRVYNEIREEFAYEKKSISVDNGNSHAGYGLRRRTNVVQNSKGTDAKKRCKSERCTVAETNTVWWRAGGFLV